MWCVSELDDEFVTRMEDVLDLYERPINSDEPVICLVLRPHESDRLLTDDPGHDPSCLCRIEERLV